MLGSAGSMMSMASASTAMSAATSPTNSAREISREAATIIAALAESIRLICMTKVLPIACKVCSFDNARRLG